MLNKRPITISDDGLTAKVILTRGFESVIDFKSIDVVRDISWSAHKQNGEFYAYGCVGGSGNNALMHRLLLGITDPYVEVDHKDGDRMNNRIDNLRLCKRGQNCANRKSWNKNSEYKGCYLKNGGPKWQLSMTVNKKVLHLGNFDSEIECAKAYNENAIKFHGEFAKLNIIKGEY
jgi:hypothetical protein